jgi:hypothetical protein
VALNDDKKPVVEGRRNTFEGEVPTASLRDQIPKKLLRQLNDLNIGQQVAELWNSGNANRSEWLDNQTKLMHEFEEFVAPIYDGAYSWSSTIHLPVAYTICRTFHSRMFGALTSFDPPFTVAARQEANTDRAPMIQGLMRYLVRDWANDYQGIEDVLDRWLWVWVTSGRGVLKARWEKKYSRILDVVQVRKPVTREIPDGKGEMQPVTAIEMVEEEQEVIVTDFNGPQVEMVLPEDILIIGGDGDPNRADAVLHQQYLTASDLWQLVDQDIFDADAVKKVIEGGGALKSSDITGAIKQERAEVSQAAGIDVSYDDERYQVIEAYIKKVVDKSGIASDIVVWVNPTTRAVLRASYLRRLSQSGKRPFACIDFHRRTDTQHPVGLVELTYSLTKEMDAIHNMRLDFGLISTLPFGYYRANSSLTQTKIAIEPGSLTPVDNPATDIFFPNLGNRTSWGMQEEGTLYQYIERMTSVSDLSLGILGAQGASRTATGSRIVANENNSNLDIYLKRMNRGFKQLLHLLFEQVQQRIEPGFAFRVLGEDGNAYYETIKSREEICGMYDFELEPSSAASNKQVQVDTAQQVYQLTSNPLDIQLGIITPSERYAAIKNLMQAMGIKNWSKFVRQPQGFSRLFTPEEIANRTLAGIDVKLGPEQDLPGIVSYIQYMFDTDEIMGQFQEDAIVKLRRKQMEAEQMLAALQEQQAQAAVAQQMNNNAATSQQQTNVGNASPLVGTGGA